MDLKETPSIATQLVVPSWWVRAYEAASRAEITGAGAMQLAADAGLAPALTIVELNALATVLSCLQAQILAGAKTLVITAEEHLKNASTNSKSRRFAFEKLVQILAGLRLLAPQPTGFASHPLFGKDQWTMKDGGELAIELEPAELGIELALGLSDAHWDLVRRAQGKTPASQALHREAPLTLWRSIWLELQSHEQWLFLRMERGMQWEFRWLQLDGVFGLSLREMFDGMPLPAAAGPVLAQRLKLLAKLGKKLCSHGFLAREVHDQFLALDDGGKDGVTAVWQVSRDRLASEAAESYRSSVADALMAHRQPALLPDLASIILGDASAGDKDAAVRLHSSLADAKLKLPAPLGLDAAPNQLVSPLNLFWELAVRKARGTARFALPGGLLEGRAAAFFADDKPAPERLEAFAAYLVEDPDFTRAVRDLPFASFASPVTGAEPAFAEALKDALNRRAGGTIDPARPRLVAQGQTEAAAPAAKKKAQVNGVLAARMLKVASEELQKLKAKNPDRYRALKKSYMESLDELGRKLMLDVQRRMQPSMFDEHLRQRLVRFMVDNPGAWRSPSAQLAEV